MIGTVASIYPLARRTLWTNRATDATSAPSILTRTMSCGAVCSACNAASGVATKIGNVGIIEHLTHQPGQMRVMVDRKT